MHTCRKQTLLQIAASWTERAASEGAGATHTGEARLPRGRDGGRRAKGQHVCAPRESRGSQTPAQISGRECREPRCGSGDTPKAPDPLTRRGKSVPLPPWAGAATAFTAMAL